MTLLFALLFVVINIFFFIYGHCDAIFVSPFRRRYRDYKSVFFFVPRPYL